jgi:hypothetical protein
VNFTVKKEWSAGGAAKNRTNSTRKSTKYCNKSARL